MKNTVLVTAVGSFSAEAVIRRYKEMGYCVLGCDIYPAEWIVASMEVDRFFRAPLAADREAYLAFLEQVCRENQVEYLVPLTDVEVDAVNGWRDWAAGSLGLQVCLSPADTVSLCRDKGELAKFLEGKGAVRAIPTRGLREVIRDEADTGYELLSYPLVLKPAGGRSSQGLTVAEDADQMRRAAESLEASADSYLVQPRISGCVITADIVRSPKTGQVVCLPRRELLRTPNGAGTSVYVFRDEALETICRELAVSLDICGCVNFEFIEEREGSWYFLECNPRFSGGVAFSCMAGYDMVGNHMRCFTGERLDEPGVIKNQYLVKRYTEYRTRTEPQDMR